jgi:hypothetical protein
MTGAKGFLEDLLRPLEGGQRIPTGRDDVVGFV